MQKIKYPVGSIIDAYCKNSRKIVDVTKNEYVCFLQYMNGELEDEWFTQEKLDKLGYELVSSPRWIPEKGQKYWAIEALMEEIGMFEKIFTNNIVDKYFLKTDNMFRTLEECQKKIEEINSREI